MARSRRTGHDSSEARSAVEVTNTLELRRSPGSVLTVQVKPAGNVAGDSDGDGVRDDGDASGVVGDAPCTGGATSGCDDDCVADANPSQLDADRDGIGNACDGDFDQDELVDARDLDVLEACMAGGAPPQDPGCTESDLNGDGRVDLLDRAAFDRLWSMKQPSAGCGIGPELLPALAVLAALRRRRSSRAAPPGRRAGGGCGEARPG